ncbi:MAG: aminodeoxychorismate/anthranilate synthase component II [Methanomassiliicoccales archaeon]|jgi:anthranilate synthase/aminodeoxychorismate synthase-like glutamine amidotransferase
MRILMLDNYDSFVYNLKQYVGELGPEVTVVRNDAIDIQGIRRFDPDAIMISPGPGHPAVKRDFGVCAEALTEICPAVPTLGVCLGHQGIAHHFGGTVTRAAELMHGKTSVIEHDGEGVFAGLEGSMVVGRYHSLVVSDVPESLKVTARTADGTIMGIRHRRFPIEGVQFHPESILTPKGKDILANFIAGARC